MNRRRTTANLFPWAHRQFLLHSDSGATSGASGGGSAAGSNGIGTANSSLPGDTVATPQFIGFEQFAQSMDRFTNELGSKFDALRGDVGQLPSALRPELPPPATPDYDTMTNGELVSHVQSSLMSAIERKLGEMLSPVIDRVNDVQQTTFRDKITAERDTLTASHKDFSDWKAEMIDLAKTHPTLGLRQLYNLARTEHAEKAATLDAKYAPPAPPPPPKWGGLTPAFSASPGAPKLSREDASKEAYREVASRHPGVLAALESM